MASGNPSLTLERMLNGRTTLKTQKLTHNNIICIGTELLNEIQEVMREDKEKAVREAVAAAEATAEAELRQSLKELREKMDDEREQALEEARLAKEHTSHERPPALERAQPRAEEQMAEIQYRCEVAEKKRARSAFERFQEEKRTALEKSAYEAEKRKQEEMRALTENLTKKLRNEASLQREIALGEALAVARKNAERRRQESIKETKRECERQAAAEAARVGEIHRNKCDEFNERINHLTRLLRNENTEKVRVEESFHEMKEDYKRFQDYTKGFNSDYLMK